MAELETTQFLTPTYLLLTAKNLLQNMGVKLSDQELTAQLADKNSFYYQVLAAMALNTYNNMLLDQIADLQLYCQEMLMNMIFAYYALKIENPEWAEVQIGISENLEFFQHAFENNAEEYEQLQTSHLHLKHKTLLMNQQQVQAWQDLQIQNAAAITAELENQGMQLSTNFKQRLQKNLQQMDADFTVSASLLKKLKLKQQPDFVTKAIIHTLIQDWS
jgi:hypothetical protein